MHHDIAKTHRRSLFGIPIRVPVWLYRSLFLIGCYAFWIVAFRLVSLTILTYFMISPDSHFQNISDALVSNEVSLMGLSAALFMALLYWLFPQNYTKTSEFLSPKLIEKKFVPGFFRGTLIAGAVVLVFVLSGVYKFLGSFIQFDEAPLAVVNVFLRMLALVLLAYCEEFLFHHKLSQILKNAPRQLCVLWVAALYCGVKIIQFDLGWSQLTTLFLLSISLFYRTESDGSFTKSAGLWAAILILWHPLLSLPIFGNTFSGIMLIKYLPIEASSGLITEQGGLPSTWIRYLSGGMGGPLSSLTFQLLLILDIGRSILYQRKKA